MQSKISMIEIFFGNYWDLFNNRVMFIQYYIYILEIDKI